MAEETLRTRLLAEAEKVINELPEDKPAASPIRLDEIERLVLRAGQQVQANILKALAEDSSEADQAEERVCETCGSRMQRRGKRARQVVTEAGELTLARGYYVCPGCGARSFPPR